MKKLLTVVNFLEMNGMLTPASKEQIVCRVQELKNNWVKLQDLDSETQSKVVMNIEDLEFLQLEMMLQDINKNPLLIHK